MHTQSAALIVAAIFSTSMTVGDMATTFWMRKAPDPIEGYAHVGRADVTAGETVDVEWSIIKRTDCGGQNGRVWDGDRGFHVSEVMMPSGIPQSEGLRVYVIPTKVPQGAPDGELRLKISGFYQCPGSDPQHFTLPTDGPLVLNVVGK